MRLHNISVTARYDGWLVSWPHSDDPARSFTRWFDTWPAAIGYTDRLAGGAVVREVEGSGTRTTRVVFPEWVA